MALLALLAAPAQAQLLAHQSASLKKRCGSCHRGHGVPGTPMLPLAGEKLCFSCHGNSAARAQLERDGLLTPGLSLRDISLDFRRPYRHPVGRTRGVHRPGEVLPERESRLGRHVQCADCHRAHRTVRSRTVSGRRGLQRRSTLDGTSTEYALCYRCHSESANMPRTASNIRRKMQPSNVSYHAVEAPGRGRYVPSLLRPWTTGSRLSCGDCHGNDIGRGMHGSRYAFLLKKNYTTNDGTPESAFAYDHCYQCHDRQSVMSGRGFSEHKRHVSGARISCASCHDAHGSDRYPHLLVFDPSEVRPDAATGRLAYISTGQGRGTCYLTCHNVQHSGSEYCEPGDNCRRGQQRSPLRNRGVRGSGGRSPFSF